MIEEESSSPDMTMRSTKEPQFQQRQLCLQLLIGMFFSDIQIWHLEARVMIRERTAVFGMEVRNSFISLC